MNVRREFLCVWIAILALVLLVTLDDKIEWINLVAIGLFVAVVTASLIPERWTLCR